MSKSLNAELRALGIPFFTIRDELVDSSCDPVSESHSSDLLKPGELKALRLQMLQLLEDLCKDWCLGIQQKSVPAKQCLLKEAIDNKHAAPPTSLNTIEQAGSASLLLYCQDTAASYEIRDSYFLSSAC